jgi:hypothetical protein
MSDTTNSSELLTADDLAARWRCERATVLRRRKQWGLKAAKFGREPLFLLEHVEECERRRAAAAE